MVILLMGTGSQPQEHSAQILPLRLCCPDLCPGDETRLESTVEHPLCP